jgi:hypothetical protein
VIPETILLERLADRDRFLSHFPPERRGYAGNLLLFPVRRGCTDPHQVVGYALESAHHRPWNEACLRLLELQEEDPEALLAGARWALWWESLPLLERQRIKAERSETAIERWMAEQPPTEKQLRYLASLGYPGPTPANRLEASRLIDELVKGVRRA